jgi:hypothetical protein
VWTLPEGALVTLCIGAANRDPAQFANLPETLDLQREDNRHLAFGFGIHQCAGLSLARLEGRIAIGRFLAALSRLPAHAAPGAGRAGAVPGVFVGAVCGGLTGASHGLASRTIAACRPPGRFRCRQSALCLPSNGSAPMNRPICGSYQRARRYSNWLS